MNEARLDWVHTKAKSVTADEVTAEIEKGFGALTLEAEFPLRTRIRRRPCH